MTKETLEAEATDPAALPVSPESEEPTPAEIELKDFFENIGGNEIIIKIYKMENGQKAYCGSAEPATITEDAILRSWGGGRYVLQAISKGVFVRGASRTITLHEQPVSAFKPAEQTVAPTNEIAILRESINRQHEMILKMLEQNNAQSAMPDMLEMFKAIQVMTPKTPDLSTLLPTVIDLFGKSMELARESSGGEDSKMQWFKLATGALEKLPSLVGAVMRNKTNGGAAPPGNQAPVVPMDAVTAESMLREGIAWLKKKAIKGSDVSLYVDMISDNMDDPTYQNLAVLILNQPFESFAKLDPDIDREPLKAWFQSFYSQLRAAFDEHKNTDSIAGAGGGGSGAPGNEAPDN